MLNPSRILDFLGLHFNLESAIISPPDSFLDSLTSVLSCLSTSMVMPACKISSITSRISHFAPFIHHGRQPLRFLQFWIKRHWAQHRQSWDTPLQLDADFLSHLRLVQQTGRSPGSTSASAGTQPVLLHRCITNRMGHQLARSSPLGTVVSPDSSQHINWLELEAIRLAVLQWVPQWLNQTVPVHCDNSTAVAYIRKQGGTHSISLFNKTLELFHLLDQFGILLIPTHLPGARNVTADALSRLNSPSPTEWRLPQETWLNLFSVLGTSPSGHVCHGRDSNLCFTLPGRQNGDWRPLHILGRPRPSVRLPSISHSPQNSPEDQGLPRHHSDSNCFPVSVSTVKPVATTTQPASSHSTLSRISSNSMISQVL